MKTLYIECNMGAAGDMLMAGLLELIEKPDDFIVQMNNLGLDGVQIEKEKSVKCGITGTHMKVTVKGTEETSIDVPVQGHAHAQDYASEHAPSHTQKHSHEHLQEHGHSEVHGYLQEHEHTQEHGHSHEHEHSHKHGHSHEHEHSHKHGHSHEHEHTHSHHHSGLMDITDIINNLPIPEQVKENAISIYKLIAQAESHAHDRPITEVHFHEVGSMDAIADIVGVCLLINEIAPEQIIVSPINVGSGFVRCAHGVLPVPAPATAHILKGVPFFSGNMKGELCTPTGAAILKHFATEFKSMPEIIVEKIGYGMGKKDFEIANCVRIFLGETKNETAKTNDSVAELMCNIDDMTGEAIGHAVSLLLENGALDVFTIPVQMKKNRPGTLLVCVCKLEQSDQIAALILKHTTTFGVRKNTCTRYILDREFSDIPSPYGNLTLKTGRGYGVTKSKIEYEDAAKAASLNNVSIQDIYNSVSNK